MKKLMKDFIVDMNFYDVNNEKRWAYSLIYTHKYNGKYYFESLIYPWIYICDGLEDGANVLLEDDNKNIIQTYKLKSINY